jgi:signal transduction histidine kinase
VERFVPSTLLTRANLLLPEHYTAAQLELRAYLEQLAEQLCPIRSLAQAVIRAQDLRVYQEIATGPVLCVTYHRGLLKVTEYDISRGELQVSLPDDAVILAPTDKCSIGYLSTALDTELCKRQIAALGLGEPEVAPSPIEIVSSVLVPRPDTPEGKDLARRMLSSPPNRAADPVLLRFVAPPFSEAEMVANAVLVSDGQILPAVTADPASHYLYLEHLNPSQISSADEGTFPSTMTVILRGTSPAVLNHAPIAGAALRQVVGLFKRSPYAFAWLNLPQEVASATGLASTWVREKALRQALREAFSDLIKADESRAFLTIFDEIISDEIEPEALLEAGKTNSSTHSSSASTMEYTLESLENGLLAWLRARRFLTPRALASRAIASGVTSPTLSPQEVQETTSEDESLPDFAAEGAVSSFALIDPLRLLMEQHLPESIGDPCQRGTRPLLIQGPFGAGKSALLTLLASVAANRDALTLNPDLRRVASLQPMAGRYRVIVASQVNGPLLYQLVGGLRQYSAWSPANHPVGKAIDQSRVLGAIKALAESPDGRGVLVVIDEFDPQDLQPEDLVLLINLTEMQSTTSVRVILAGQEALPERFESTLERGLATFWKRVIVARLPEWNPRDFSRQVKASFSPFLAIRLPWLPKGPGGVLLMPWEPSQIGLAEPYVEALIRNLDQQQVILARVRSQISDEIVGRIRHRFNNRIESIELDLKELLAAANTNSWGLEQVVPGGPRSPDYYNVIAFLGRMLDSLASLSQMVERVSQYYRTKAPVPRNVNLQDIVGKKVQQKASARPDVGLVTRYDPIAAVVRLDPDLFEEVLDNILGNSCDAMDKNKGHQLEVMLNVVRERVVLEICNTGPRELPDQPTRPGITTKAKGNTGLGLAIVERNIREAGGTFAIFPRPMGVGITNRIELPNAHWHEGELHGEPALPDRGG